MVLCCSPCASQYMRLAKIVHLKWWRQEQISRAYDREMMMREEAYGWAVVLKEHIAAREIRAQEDMGREDTRSRMVGLPCPLFLRTIPNACARVRVC